MSTTIFCSFEHQDLADLAMGHVRRLRGVKNIQFLIEHDPERQTGYQNATAGPAGSGALFRSSDAHPPGIPPGPASIQIVCEEEATQKVIASLINLHAHRIVTAP